MDLSAADGSTTFLEMGFDSLFLTQVTQALQNKFGLKITFRQLLGDQSTMNALAEYVDSQLPADVLAEPATTPTAAAPGPGCDGSCPKFHSSGRIGSAFREREWRYLHV